MTSLLLSAAALLGFLAFFEPCTIATHTLFSARAHRQSNIKRYRSLLTVWLTRSVLLATLLWVIVTISAPPIWDANILALILSIIATIYIVSRFTYLPIPHLLFYRLLPGGNRMSPAIRLGLTLPACTIPLFIVIIGIAIMVNSGYLAALAGLLFATLFTAPLVLTAVRGIHADGADLLQHTATASPVFTAILLYGAAIFLLLQSIQFDPAYLQAALLEANVVGIALSFLAGFIFSFNPVSFASIPVVLAYVTKSSLTVEHKKRRALVLGAAFVMGLLITHILLGATAAIGGEWVKTLVGSEWGLVLGPLLIVMGLLWPGWITIRLPWPGFRGRIVAGPWGAFLLGIPFSVAVCPICTPALIVILTASAAVGSPLFAMALLLSFALGRSIPIMLGAWSMGWLESLKILSRHQKKIETILGSTLIIIGLYLLGEYVLHAFFDEIVLHNTTQRTLT